MFKVDLSRKADQVRIAYLVSRYPTANHTFILREIVALRGQGFDLGVFAIRGADRPEDRLTSVERAERAKTFVVLPPGWRFLAAHVATLLRRPVGYARGIATAIQLSGADLKKLLYHLIYFLEAVVAGVAVKKAGFRHVHTHFSSTVALLASRIFGFTLSITIHGPDEFRDTAGFGMREKVASASFVVAISQYARSQIMWASDPADWPKIEVCGLGVDPSVYTPGAREKADDSFRIVCVGRLAPVKAQEILIRACQSLTASGYKLKLNVVGSGPDEARLRKIGNEAGDFVVFEGLRNQEEVISIYRQCDVFALPSFAEGVPVVLMEAMAMQIPCVATWVNGVPELIASEEQGLLVAPSDEQGLTEAIRRLLDDVDLRRSIGAAARAKVLCSYDLNKNVTLLGEIFRRRLRAHERSAGTAGIT